jgi:HAD superfamily hydrolase (TIGR01509 family)
VIDFDFDRGMERMVGSCGLPAERFKEIVFAKDWIRPYERGEISTEAYHRYLCESGQLRMELAEFHQSWSAVFLPELLVPEALLAHLAKRYPLILVSNTNASHVDYIARHYNVFPYFDARIFSHVVGALKPDPAIYEAAIAASGRPAEALFFIDDREENVRGAESMGIRAHQFTSLPNLLKTLRANGVEIEQPFV